MSTIERFYNTDFTVKRMTWDEDESTEEEIGEFTGGIQQARPEVASNLGLSFTKTFSIWCKPFVEVEEGDKLVIQVGDKLVLEGTDLLLTEDHEILAQENLGGLVLGGHRYYTVRAKQENFDGRNPHIELICELIVEDDEVGDDYSGS